MSVPVTSKVTKLAVKFVGGGEGDTIEEVQVDGGEDGA